MSFDEDHVRRALEARSGEPTPEYRSRLRRAVAGAPGTAASSSSWMAAVAVIVVTLLTATSVGVLVAYRHSRQGGVASGPRVSSPSPFPTESPIVLPGQAQLSAPSHGVAWVLVDSTALFRSTDAGLHWERRALPPSTGERPLISFVSESEGWWLSGGSPATQCEVDVVDIWHTKDGARTWQDLGERIDKTQCKDGMWFVDSMHGFVSASDPNHRPTVYRTSDGGLTWSRSTVPDNPLFQTGPGGFTLHVDWMKTFGQTVYLQASGSQDDPTWHDRSFVYTSGDGGVTWKWRQKLASAQTVMVTESRWLQYSPDFEESVNGGQAFSPYGTDFAPLSPVLGGTVMVFVDAAIGYATGRGELERTTDGGAHWAVIPTPGTQAPPSPSPSPIPMPADVQVSAPSAYTIFALVNSTYLFRSTDKGKTWVQKTLPPGGGGGTIPVIAFLDDYHGYILFPGEPGTQCQQAAASLYATSDSANTWELVSIVKSENRAPQGLPFDQCKDYMYFLDPYFGFVAGHDTAHSPVISRTENGGRTWDQSTLPDPPGFTTDGGGASLRVTQIKNFGGSILLEASAPDAGGAQLSFVYESRDGGATWSFLEPARGDEVFVTSTRWLRLAGNVPEETTDAGQTWHPFVTEDANPDGVRSVFVFVDASTGYGVAGGRIERTADGGATWSLVKSSWP